MTRPGQRVVVMPAYTVVVALVTVLVLCVGTLFAAVAISNSNSRDLVAQYRADQAAQAEANRAFYCSVFARQADVFEDAVTPTGKAAYGSWIELYRFARCVPAR